MCEADTNLSNRAQPNELLQLDMWGKPMLLTKMEETDPYFLRCTRGRPLVKVWSFPVW